MRKGGKAAHQAQKGCCGCVCSSANGGLANVPQFQISEPALRLDHPWCVLLSQQPGDEALNADRAWVFSDLLVLLFPCQEERHRTVAHKSLDAPGLFLPSCGYFWDVFENGEIINHRRRAWDKESQHFFLRVNKFLCKAWW